MINIMIADDHKVLLDGFSAIINNIDNLQVVATSSNGEEVLDQLSSTEVDIILLDINMPILNGVETCKKITKRFPKVKVIALSMYGQRSFIKRMKQNGAKGYVLKDDSALVLIEAINIVYDGGEYYSKQVKELLINDVISMKSPFGDSLTNREKEVLELLAKGLTNNEIGETLFLSSHTIISHRKNMVQKFGAKNTAELIKITMEKGLI